MIGEGAAEGLSGLLAGLALGRLARHERRVDVVEHGLAGDDDPGDVLAGRHLVHHREQDLFHDRAQAAGAGAAQHRLVGDRLERVVVELELDVVELEQLARTA